MIIYYHGSPDKGPVAEYTLFCAPGGHLPRDGLPGSFFEQTKDGEKPKEFTVKFFSGQAEVDDELGAYLIATGLARKTRLIIPAPWER